LTLAELEERKTSMGYKFEREDIIDKGEKWNLDEFLNEIATSSQQETKAGIGKSVLYKVIQNWHKVEDDKGTLLRKITTTCGSVELLDKDYPYEGLDIPDPFIPIVDYPALNRVEGNTTADLLTHLQHGINDFFNLIIDAVKYGFFPPNLQDSRATIESPMKIAPGAKWVVNVNRLPDGSRVKDALSPMFSITPTSKEFFALIERLLERAEIASGASEDILMSGQTDPQEKATKTEYRAKAASTRLAGINLLMDVESLKRLGRVIWIMRLERLSYDEKYKLTRATEPAELGLEQINGRFDFDVPHLSGMAEREIKITKLKELLVSLADLGLLQAPPMIPVLHDILRRISHLSLLPEFDEIFPEEVMLELRGALENQVAQGEGATTATSKPGEIPEVVQAAMAEQELTGGGM